MIVRKNISIDQCYVDKLKPFLEKNNGNLSAAIRDAIETASLALAGNTGESEENDPGKVSQNAEFRNKLIEEEEFLLVHHTLFEWLVKKTSGLMIDESIVYEVINPYKVKRIPDVISYINSLNEKMGWKVKVEAEYSQDPEPEAASLILSNGNSYFRGIMAHSLAIYLAKQMKLDVQGIFCRSNITKVYFKRFEFLDYQKVPKGLEKYFGPMERAFREIQKKPEFWKNLIKTYRQQNYQRLSMNRKTFEAFVSGNLPSMAEVTRNFELATGKPPSAFTLSEHIMIFKEIYLTDSIGSDIEICTEIGREYVKLIHDYSDRKMCETITKYYSTIFKSIGYPFTATVSPHMILFEFGKRPGSACFPEITGLES
ncbi:hypothetical protein EQO05_01955 [Methanosarcina sp. MSH10X1]|uniref:hypothetical protein n=1 Tax=Methanosarcina sp. MSH10X1 TaxID=2507075 RepID=UPI000FFC23B4|nr:hypothetical protein [Methanosarcina sp. MSH10X1]RXA21222.1 hypothetical protein EQO05_01955 [Methanosarcina sp. MSH10X1]